MKAIFIFFSLALIMKRDMGFDNRHIRPFDFTQSNISKDLIWTESLSDFRKALLNVDIKTVKQFFPVLAE
jgi:hypothetical protein